MRIKLSILLLLLSAYSFGQKFYDDAKISKPTMRIVKKLAKYSTLKGSAVGYSGIMPEEYIVFEQLSEQASEEELVALTDHLKPVVRCYAFWALIDKDYPQIFKIVKTHVKDEERIESQFGCVVTEEYVGDIFLSFALNYEDEHSRFTISQLKELDSLIINSDSNLFYRDFAISRMEPTASNYPKVLELANTQNERALIKLAEYRNEKDIELYMDYYKTITQDDSDKLGIFYEIILKYPHQEFFPILESELIKTMDNDHYSGSWANMYAAIASYKNYEALQLLQMPFQNAAVDDIKPYHLNYVHDSVMEHPDTLYDVLLWQLWAEYNIISLESYKYLFKLDPDRAYTLTLNQFQQTPLSKHALTVSIDKFSNIEDIEELMLNIIRENDKDVLDKIIVENIKSANVHDLPLYLEFAKQTNNAIFLEPMFSRLQSEPNAYNYLEIVTTLISYKDNKVNNRILEVRKQNPAMNEDWGSESLDRLLKENNIR